MSKPEVRRAEEILIRVLKNSPKPLSTGELLQRRVRTKVSAAAVKRAVWNLVDEGKIKFTNDRRLMVDR
jgi:hypothetical protein